MRKYLDKAGAPPEKLVHLGRGVDTALFDPRMRDEEYHKELAPNGEVVLMCCGRLAPEKGFKFLADAVERLQENGLKFTLLIVGGNKSPSVEEDVRRLFDKFGDKVIFTGFQQGVDLARQYASGDIFLHCSITETFGLVNLEAMASGLPVVARDEGGPSEIIMDQKTGYLTPPHDLDSFVAHVETLARQPKLRATMSATARQVALDTTWNKINNRVAVQLAAALDHTPEPYHRPIRNWILKHFIAVSSSFIVVMKINAAIGLIAFIWLIAVVPLLIHGNSKFPSLRSRVHSMPTWNALGDMVSGWLLGKAPGSGQ